MSYFEKTTVSNINSSAFGDQSISLSHPFVQSAPVYNLIPANFREFTATGGTTGVESHMFKTTTGTSSGGYGAIQSFRSLNYKAGEGGLARFTGKFTAGVASSWQGVGLINLGDELSFGYNGTAFGIWHRHNGIAEVQTLTLTTQAGGSENATLTLNSVAYTIPLTAGSLQHNAYEIEAWLNDTANQTVWVADQLDDTVIISALSDGAKAGTYSLSSGTAVGTLAQGTAGVAKTSDFVAQTSWNRDTMASLDPTMGNVFQIRYQYLGFGAIFYEVEDPATGVLETVHVIEYANANTVPSLGNPSLKAGLYCVSLGSTTDLSTYAASFGLFVQGVEGRTRNPRAVKNTQGIVKNVFTSVLTVRNRRTYNNQINQVEIQPELLAIASEGSKNVEVEIRSMVTPGVELDFQPVGTNLVSDYATTGVTVTAGRLLMATVIAGGTSELIDLAALRIRIPPSLKLVIQAKVSGTGANADFSAALTYYEDL